MKKKIYKSVSIFLITMLFCAILCGCDESAVSTEAVKTQIVESVQSVETQVAEEAFDVKLTDETPVAGTGYDIGIVEERKQDPVVVEETQTEVPAEENSTLVWIVDSGKKYHSSPYCSNMGNPYQVTVEEAQESGRTPCSKCW